MAEFIRDRAAEGLFRYYLNLQKREQVLLDEPLKQQALEQVLRYARLQQEHWDRIRGAGDTVEIMDFKSDKRPDPKSPAGKRKIARYRRQMQVYAYLVEQRTGQAPPLLHQR